MNDISIVVVTYNGAEFMPGLFRSIKEQGTAISEVIVIHNSEDTATTDLISEIYPSAKIHRQKNNLDFAKGYNLGMSLASSEYVLIVNQDMVLDSDAVKNMHSRMQADTKLGAVAPKLLRLQEDSNNDPIIDGMGISSQKNHRFTNIGEGERDEGQYDQLPAPFALSGAAIMFRHAALKDLAEHSGDTADAYFDPDFVAYKEDIDLSYRLHHLGWEIGIVPKAIIYHKRTAQELKASTGLKNDRSEKSYRIRGNSLRNQWWLLLKNEPWINLLIFSPWIKWYEFKKLFFMILFERDTLRIMPGFFKKLPKMLKKRRAILTSSKISGKKLRQLLLNK